VPPLNLVGDFGGGGMMMAFGMVCGLLEAKASGEGQVIDAAMVDGAALLATMMFELAGQGAWAPERGTNLLDTGSWFYEVYATSDGRYVSFGSIEPQFFSELLRLTGLADDIDGQGAVPPQSDRQSWPAMKRRLAAIVATKTRDEWCELIEGTDTCFAPVLGVDEAHLHPHNAHRGTFTEIGGAVQPGPAPRFSRTEPATPAPAPQAGQHTDEILGDWGFPAADVDKLREAGAIR
jgi:alpha-methylacyl-CoA racemase